MSEVLAFREGLVEQCDRLRHHDERAGELDAAMTSAVNDYKRVAEVLRGERLDCAPRLGAVVTEHLVSLGMPHARFEVDVAGTDGGEVEFLLPQAAQRSHGRWDASLPAEKRLGACLPLIWQSDITAT